MSPDQYTTIVDVHGQPQQISRRLLKSSTFRIPPPKPPTPERFPKIFNDPLRLLLKDNVEMKVNRATLFKIPFFEALLEGRVTRATPAEDAQGRFVAKTVPASALHAIVEYLEQSSVAKLVMNYPRHDDFDEVLTLMDFLLLPLPTIPPLDSLITQLKTTKNSRVRVGKATYKTIQADHPKARNAAVLLYMGLLRGGIDGLDEELTNKLYQAFSFIFQHPKTFTPRLRQRLWNLAKEPQYVMLPFTEKQWKELEPWRPLAAKARHCKRRTKNMVEEGQSGSDEDTEPEE